VGTPETSYGKEKANDVSCMLSLYEPYGSQKLSIKNKMTKLHYRIGKEERKRNNP